MSLGCGGSQRESVPPYRHVLVITMDTTRADHLGIYGAEVAKTPALDALGLESVVFEACTSAAATTLASHTSLFTGTYPLRHGVGRNGFLVGDDNVLLPERLGEAGFYCAAVLGSKALTSKSGFDEGFHHYDDEFSLAAEAGVRDQDQRLAGEVTAALLGLVDGIIEDGIGEERLFLFAHYFDPHAPYAPTEDLVARYGASFGVGDFQKIEVAVRQNQARALSASGAPVPASGAPGQQGVIEDGLSPELIRGTPGLATKVGKDLAKLYAGEITLTDAAIGTLLAGLAQRGLLQDTLVVITADHGETFWEHANFWNHGLWVSETDVHVPLLMRFPDGRGAGKRVSVPVSGVDVVPTLLEALELPADFAGVAPPAMGRSLLPAIDGAELPERAVFSEATQPGARAEKKELRWLNARKPQAVRLGPWKLVDAPYMGLKQLFHLGRDPGETRDLLRQPVSEESAAIALELERALELWRASADPVPSTYDSRQTKDLKGMGY